ncbi:cGMP-specific 3',5'-cyclic phosphodiesterase [Channa argus]|uniref:cGMP-specific 3',5'-cyclic phosphodiesterase n=1 Tax=Channa argus TaxID=215402 RepID=UPI00351FD929
MPCLHSEALDSMDLGSAPPATSRAAGSLRVETLSETPTTQGKSLFFSPALEPHRTQRPSRTFGDKVEAWLDDHYDFTRTFFLRRASAVSSDHSVLVKKTRHGVNNSLNISSLTDKLKPLTSHLSAPNWMDHCSPHVLGGHSPCSRLSSRSSCFSFSPCRPLSPVCSQDLLHCPQLLHSTTSRPATCGHCEGCPWMVDLLRGDLSLIGSVAELCHGAVLHTRELLAAECGSLALVKEDCSGRRTLEEVIAPTALGCLGDGNNCSQAHMELLKGAIGCVLATESPLNLRDASEDQRFDADEDQSSDFKIRTLLSVPIKNYRGEVVGVVVMINKRSFGHGLVSVFTSMDEKVLSSHMDMLGMVLDNVQLYESSRQEAKRSQALIEMAHVLSKEHHSFEVGLSKMAATIMPFTNAQYCTIFILSEQTSLVADKVSFSRVIYLECEELGSTIQIYRRERDVRDIDSSHALRSLVTMETLNMSGSSDGSIKSLICCPVRNERSEHVIAVCQLMNKHSRDSDEMEPFNRFDERLLEDLAVYCGLALQYAQTVQITEERRASIEVTQEVLSYHITAAEQEIQALQEATIPSAESLHILDFHFSDFGLPEDLTIQATIRMFLDLNLVQDFNINYKTLCQWVLTVRRGYRNNVLYHNWSHALSTAQSMFAMLIATKQLQTTFSRLEILALMIATLNHDLDHRGVNNSFIERSQQPLAQLYGHSSLENHHYNMCLFILSNTGSQILSGISAEDHKTLLHMIKRAILATDLTIYMERRNEFFALAKKSRVNWKSEKHRDLLRSMLMTASDLSAITKPWPEQKRIASLVAMEFFAQGDKEKEEFKIKPIDIMNRENTSRLPHMQVEYIDEICYPLYKALSRIFDTCSPLLSGCKKNRENWMHLAEKAEEQDSENSSSATLETHLKTK